MKLCASGHEINLDYSNHLMGSKIYRLLLNSFTFMFAQEILLAQALLIPGGKLATYWVKSRALGSSLSAHLESTSTRCCI